MAETKTLDRGGLLFSGHISGLTGGNSHIHGRCEDVVCQAWQTEDSLEVPECIRSRVETIL